MCIHILTYMRSDLFFVVPGVFMSLAWPVSLPHAIFSTTSTLPDCLIIAILGIVKCESFLHFHVSFACIVSPAEFTTTTRTASKFCASIRALQPYVFLLGPISGVFC